MEPWGISGPQFLVMYCIGLVLALAWALWSRYRVRRPEAPALGQQAGVAELAFLTGGPRRVVEVAIARLVETGQIHVARNGVLTAADGAHSGDRVQAAVLREVGRRPRPASSIVRTVSDGTAVTAIGDQLVEQRLLVAPAKVRAARRRSVLGFYVVAAVGVVRLVNGVRLDLPVGYLFVLLLLTGVLVSLLLRRKVKARTVHGDQVLASVRGRGVHEPDRELPPAVALAGVGGAVALGGLAAFPDIAIRNALLPTSTTTSMATSTGGCSSWSYSDGGGYSSSDSYSDSSGGGGSSSGSSCGSGGSSCGGGGGCGGGSS